MAVDANPEVRGWVPKTARRVLGKAAVPLIQKLTNDADPDTRGMAVDELERIDPEFLRGLSPSLRKRLESSDDGEAISSAWRLAKQHDVAAVPAIDAFRTRFEPSWWQYKAASTILLAIQDPREIARRIRDHDHEHMMWLSYAATWVDEPEARKALQECAANAPDDHCRTVCTFSLENP